MGDLDVCPFCGSQAVTFEHRTSKYDHRTRVKVMCWDCGGQTREFIATSEDRAGLGDCARLAARRWNMRAR